MLADDLERAIHAKLAPAPEPAPEEAAVAAKGGQAPVPTGTSGGPANAAPGNATPANAPAGKQPPAKDGGRRSAPAGARS